MTDQPQRPGRGSFQKLMSEVMATSEHFDHRQHIHLSWLAVRRFGIPASVELVSEGIRNTARYAGNPQKYHFTMSRAWVELVGHHALNSPVDDFDLFVRLVPELLDKRLITRFYSSAALASATARTDWVPPDRAPLPEIGM